jgi:hypothetical protein
MPTYRPYSREQAELLPAQVKDVLGADHLCFVVHDGVEACDLSPFAKQVRTRPAVKINSSTRVATQTRQAWANLCRAYGAAVAFFSKK